MTTPTPTEIIQLNFGDTVPLGSILANIILMGIATDINNPNMFAATLEAFRDQAVLTVPVLQGPPGNPGQTQFALRWQNDSKTSPTQLPTNLTDLPADLGKFWIFGVRDTNGNLVATTMYIWWGTAIGFRQLPVGAPGPPGPYPIITPNIVLEAQGSGNGPGGVDSWIAVTGSISNPVLTFHIAAPQGIPGPSAALGSCPDVDFVTRVPQPGDMLQCSSRVTPGAPTSLGAVGSTSGGTFAAGTYYWAVTSLLPNGETLVGNEASVVLTGSTSSCTLSWIAPSGQGATGYNVYRGTTPGGENRLIATIPSGATVTYIDTGTAGSPVIPPSTGVVAGRPIWVSAPVLPNYPSLYTVPEAAFTSIIGIGAATQTVCTFAVPQQGYAWKPFVWGQMQILGINTALAVGAEVRLGDANTGPIVARGFSNQNGYVTLIPHTSYPGSPSSSMTSTNAYAKVVAGHTGTAGTLYVRLVNEGLTLTYDFNAANAQISVLTIPVPT